MQKIRDIGVIMAAIWFLLAGLDVSGRCAGDVPELLNRYREALGGDKAIQAVKTARYLWEVDIMTIHGTVEEWYASPDKHLVTIDTPIVTQTECENGSIKWSRDQNDQVTISETTPQVNTTEALSIFQDVFTTDPQKVRDMGSMEREGKTYRVLEFRDAEDQPRSVYLNPETYLPVWEDGQQEGISVTTFFDDYRDVEGVRIPFYYKQQAKIPGMPPSEFHLKKVEFNIQIQPGMFDPPKESIRDFHFEGDKKRVTVLLEVEGDHIFVEVNVNGKGPYRFLLDSGAGATIVSEDIADTLHLEVKKGLHAVGVGGAKDMGAATLESLRIGAFRIDNLHVFVGDMDFLHSVFDRDVQGVLGFDLFVRAVVTIDFIGKHLILWDPDSFDYSGTGEVIQGKIKSNLLHIPGTLDNEFTGDFRVDTGAGGGVHLHAPFVKENDLTHRYHPHYSVEASGVGGEQKTLLVRVHSLALGKITIDAPLATLAQQQDSGALAMTDSLGTIGNGIWKKFTVIFDYPRNRLILEPNPKLKERMEINRTGFLLENKNGKKVVHTVFPGTPAEAAGIHAGDILLKINKIKASEITLEQVKRMLSGPVGTPMKLKFERKGKILKAHLTLAEIL